jgi:hypothetical protein
MERQGTQLSFRWGLLLENGYLEDPEEERRIILR